MDDALVSSTSCDLSDSQVLDVSSDNMSHVVHALANKLLPITVFSELALRHCEDPRVINELEKIHQAAAEARELIIQIRNVAQLEVPESKGMFSLPPETS